MHIFTTPWISFGNGGVNLALVDIALDRQGLGGRQQFVCFRRQGRESVRPDKPVEITPAVFLHMLLAGTQKLDPPSTIEIPDRITVQIDKIKSHIRVIRGRTASHVILLCWVDQTYLPSQIRPKAQIANLSRDSNPQIVAFSAPPSRTMFWPVM